MLNSAIAVPCDIGALRLPKSVRPIGLPIPRVEFLRPTLKEVTTAYPMPRKEELWINAILEEIE